jgi:hypothetical protein
MRGNRQKQQAASDGEGGAERWAGDQRWLSELYGTDWLAAAVPLLQ